MAKKRKVPGYFTVTEAADRLRLSSNSLVTRYIREGRMKGIQLGKQWLIPEESLLKFELEPREPGNPMFKTERNRRKRK